MPNVKVALIGVGNCASAFVQGLHYYAMRGCESMVGLRHPVLGGIAPKDIHVVAAFDVDKRKVGRDLAEAVFAAPNVAPKVADVPLTGVTVQKGPLLDGVGELSRRVVHVSEEDDADVAETLRSAGVEVVVNLLPSGAVEATNWYALQALEAGCAFVNATPNFIASESFWASRFVSAGLPLAGDDLVDQVGSTALHKTLLKLLSGCGVHVSETYQLDVGGGTESLETLERAREVKRAIKTQSVASSLPYHADVVAGSTDYVDFLGNKRDSYFWLRGVYFCGAPLQIDMKFSTVDAPNAGSVLFDVVRAMKLALERKLSGAVLPVCAYAFKRPPQAYPLEAADAKFIEFVEKGV
jgi:myo-inositol-1-phosphate synthase